MYYRINQIKLALGESEEALPTKILKKLGKESKGITIEDFEIIKKSLDARDKGDIHYIYTIDFSTNKTAKPLDLPRPTKKSYEMPEPNPQAARLRHRPVVCGFGPAGMFAGLVLAQKGYAPIIIERGSAMQKRIADVDKFWQEGILDTESNVQFGEGGAGTFSDGKLTTNIKDARIGKVLEEFVLAGASPEILYLQKPHIGTDKLRDIVVNIREKITSLGGEIYFDTRLDSLEVKDGILHSINITTNSAKLSQKPNSESHSEKIDTDTLILAIGHSSRDTVHTLYAQGLPMVQKPFSIGMRIEHPQEDINKAQYGKHYKDKNLPPAEYKLVHHCQNGRGVYTFCMCPGGEVVLASSEAGRLVTNGMSYSQRDGKFANSALLVDVRTEDFPSTHPLAGIDFQQKYEELAYKNARNTCEPPTCTWGELKSALDDIKSNFDFDLNLNLNLNLNSNALAVINSLPPFAIWSIYEAMPYLGKKLKGFDSKDSVFRAVESRSSSPIRIPRSEGLVAGIEGIYPAGEGAGYAGGIMSAAVDGIRCAEAIIKNYKKCEK